MRYLILLCLTSTLSTLGFAKGGPWGPDKNTMAQQVCASTLTQITSKLLSDSQYNKILTEKADLVELLLLNSPQANSLSLNLQKTVPAYLKDKLELCNTEITDQNLADVKIKNEISSLLKTSAQQKLLQIVDVVKVQSILKVAIEESLKQKNLTTATNRIIALYFTGVSAIKLFELPKELTDSKSGKTLEEFHRLWVDAKQLP